MPVFVSRSDDEAMATSGSELPADDVDDNDNAVVRPKSKTGEGRNVQSDSGLKKNIQILNAQQCDHHGASSANMSTFSDSEVDHKGPHGAENPSPWELTSNKAWRNGLYLDTKGPNGSAKYFTPISPEMGVDDTDCASQTPTFENGYAWNSLRPEGHPYLEWDELFALTDYVRLGYYEQYPYTNVISPNSADSMPNKALPQIREIETDGDDNSSNSDLFDVFVNPVAYSVSDPDESDEVVSSNDSESTISETDSDVSISRPKKSSLRDPKRPKTPPGAPSRKSVRFADALGLDLETVRHILEMDPCPSPPVPGLGPDSAVQRNAKTVLRLCFQQPGGRSDFLSRLYQQNVCLENALASDMTVMGTIKVRNLTYHKEVRVRYTWDNWTSHANILAMYVAGSCDGPTDRFSFGFSVPRRHAGVGDKVFFAVFYKVGDQEYWDNNHGLNYLLLTEEDVPGR